MIFETLEQATLTCEYSLLSSVLAVRDGAFRRGNISSGQERGEKTEFANDATLKLWSSDIFNLFSVSGHHGKILQKIFRLNLTVKCCCIVIRVAIYPK